MPQTHLVAIGLLVVAGVFLAVQGPINAALARGTGSQLLAATISFGVGFAVLALATALGTALPRATFAAFAGRAVVGLGRRGARRVLRVGGDLERAASAS